MAMARPDTDHDDEYLLFLRLSPERNTQREEIMGDLERAPRKGRVTWVRVAREQDRKLGARRRLFRSMSPIRGPPPRISRRSLHMARRRVNASSFNPTRPLRRRLLADFDLYSHELLERSRARTQRLSLSPVGNPPIRVSSRLFNISRLRVNANSMNPTRPLRRQLLADFNVYNDEVAQRHTSHSTPEQNHRPSHNGGDTPDTI